jgi:ubiquinone/menaquinone biosynthesis C-methylase UbiE
MAESGFQIAQQAAALYEQHTSTFMLPFAQAIIEAVDVRADSSVLDVACGTGFVSRIAATLVSGAGRLVGADVNPAMIAVAEERHPNQVEWYVAPAHALPFDDSEFDVALCQQGIQFFPDPVAALRESRRVLRADGQIALTAWAPLSKNPYFEAQYESISSACGYEATRGFLNAVRSDGDSWLEAIAREAGLVHVELHTITSTTILPPMESYFAPQLASTPWGTLFSGVTATVQRRVVQEATEKLSGFLTSDETLMIPFVSHLLTARVGDKS